MLILSYKAYHKYDSCCGLELRVNRNNTVTVILTELRDNPGITLVYLIEHVTTLIYNEYLRDIPVESIIWVKHKPRMPEGDKSAPEESYDQALLVWNGETFNSPRWVSLPRRDWHLYGLPDGVTITN
jgi:hypothetical protein